MNLQATQARETGPVAASNARFAYSTGDRPLAGYTIKRGIGRGGFGEVYYALSDAGKEVALKLVCRNLDVELRGVTQCLNLKHPNLLALYDIRQDDTDQSWIVMEYVVGDSLEKALAAHPHGMPIDDAMFWMQGMAAGVGYLHDHGIVHRDLKPGNVFCDGGIVKIGDYGLSKFMSCSRRSGQTGSVGTVHYMAPEVANGRYGKEIDIYALGIVLYEMITGTVPFEGESLGEVLMKHLTAEPDLSKIAEPYRTAIARALLKDPDRRLHSVGDLMALLPRSTQGIVFANRSIPLPPPLTAGFAQGAAYVPMATFARPAGGDPRTNPDAAVGAGFAAAGASPQTQPVQYGAIPPGLARREEPVWAAVRTVGKDFRNWWLSARLVPWQRVLVLILGVFVLVNTAVFWVPALLMSLVIYGAYRLVWSMLNPAPRAAFVPPGPLPIPHQAANVPTESATWRRWRGQRFATPPLASGRDRLTEFFGSLLLSAIVSGVISLVMILYRLGTNSAASIEPNQYAWLTLTSILGSWSILASVKFWEGKPGEAALQRFSMLVVGLALGWAAYHLQTALLVQLPIQHYAHSVPQFNHPLPRAFYGPDGTPSVFAFLSYFGLLWLVPKWQRQGNPQRLSRMSLWLAGVSLFWAGVVGWIMPFPQPWGFMLAGTVSIAVQLASPWRPLRGKVRA